MYLKICIVLIINNAFDRILEFKRLRNVLTCKKKLSVDMVELLWEYFGQYRQKKKSAKCL